MQSLPEATMAVDLFLLINCLTIYSTQAVQCFSSVNWSNGKLCLQDAINETTSTSVDCTCFAHWTAVASLNQTSPAVYSNYSRAKETFSVAVVGSFEMPNMKIIQEQSTRLMRKRRKFNESTSQRVISSSYMSFAFTLLNSQSALDKQSHSNQSTGKMHLLANRSSSSILNRPSNVTDQMQCNPNCTQLIASLPSDRPVNYIPVALFTEELFSGFLSRLPVPSEFAREMYQNAQRMMDQNVWLIGQVELERKLSDLVLHELITQYDRALNSNDVFLVGYDGEDTTLGQTMASLGLWPADEALSFVLKANGTLEIYFSPENLSYFLFNCLIGFLGIRYN